MLLLSVLHCDKHHNAQEQNAKSRHKFYGQMFAYFSMFILCIFFARNIGVYFQETTYLK